MFPETARDMLILQPRYLDMEPLPEERYNRLNRFVNHCRSLGIPNPYSLSDIYNADTRWKRLHPNSVPPLNDFYSNNEITDPICDHRKKSPLLQGIESWELSPIQLRYQKKSGNTEPGAWYMDYAVGDSEQGNSIDLPGKKSDGSRGVSDETAH